MGDQETPDLMPRRSKRTRNKSLGLAMSEQGTNPLSDSSCTEEEQPDHEPCLATEITLPNRTREQTCNHSESSAMKRAQVVRAKVLAESPTSPTFIKYMMPSIVATCFLLRIPSGFCTQHLPCIDTTMELVDKSGKRFNSKYLPHRYCLSLGWRGFSKAHNLEEGDVLVFQLVKKTTFQVYIIRHNVLGEMDGTRGLREFDPCAGAMASNDGEKHNNVFAKAQEPPLDSILSDSPSNLSMDPDFVPPGFRRDKMQKHHSGEVYLSCSDTLSLYAKKMRMSSFSDHLESIWRSFPADKLVHFTYLDSFYFDMYLRRTQRSIALSWIKKKNIFSSNYVFVPIICWGHWNILILCHFGESLDSENKKPCMLLLDSLHMADRKRQYEKIIKMFVVDIFKDEGITDHRVSRIRLLVPGVPQQKSFECGFFSLYFIKKFIETTTLETVSNGDLPNIDKNWFTSKEFDTFCIALDEEAKASEAIISQERALERDDQWWTEEGDVIIIK